MFTATKDKALLTTTTGALPRPSWYTENLRGIPLSQGFPASPTASSILTVSPATSPPNIVPASTFSLMATRASMTMSPAAPG